MLHATHSPASGPRIVAKGFRGVGLLCEPRRMYCLRVALAGQGSREPQPRPPLPASETVKAARPCQHLRHPALTSSGPSSPRKTLFLSCLKIPGAGVAADTHL
ncbi:hypothetical protein E2C01_050500 [Portunus trituberculatus]|uniref:Uncharacterized protein n=1 Tax=Portunus trituberculatus TaxID=210409 RepID=A0A5B7GHQ2_PORTR|nr:hypothetical protein [Portunus trituberculatus]